MEPGARRGRGWRKLIAVAGVVATACASAGAASAAGGGGGVGTPQPPKLSDVICLNRCADIRVAATGSIVQLRGRSLDGVSEVRFAAAGGGRVGATPTATESSAVEVRVPDRAATGTVRVSAYGVEAETPADKSLRIVAAGQIPDAGDFRLTSAEATPRQTFYDGVRAPGVSYVFAGKSATDVRIEVVNAENKQVVNTFVQTDAEPNAAHTARWDGLAADGTPAPGGDYEFRVGAAAGGGTRATADSDFAYHLYRFPLDAKHSYGDGYGAGRGHEGQDVFAKCGTPIHAARGGRVQTVDYQSAAGNYVVVDGKGTPVDTFYAHLVRRSPLRAGARVRTGQLIGKVGQTGDATGCHLHFEIWTAPGWYEGGHAMPSVGRLLHLWDTWS